MTGRRLVLLRHGRSAWNHARRVQGQLDAPLDDVGRAQAQESAAALTKLEPTRLWSSDLSRAHDTALAVAAATGLDVVLDERLREFFLGERQGLTHEEYAAADPAEFAQFRRGYYDAAPGAEPTDKVRARMRAVLLELLAALGPGETGVAVSHGAALRVAVGALLDWPDDQFHTLRGLDNACWLVLEEHPEVAELRLGAYNQTS